MTDKVQKIKEWISKTQDILMDVQGNSEYPEYEGAYHVLCNLDAYIDSLQEEPVSNNYSALLPCIYNRTLEERVKYCKYCSAACEGRVKEPVSEELNEAANAYISNENNYSHSRTDTFKAGAMWQKNKMMEDATEVTVHIDAGGYPYIPQIELYDYDKDILLAKEGDKYKVVLIKEE